MRHAYYFPMKRIHKIRCDLGWSQARMAAFLGNDQATVWRIEKGVIEESGPVSRLLSALASAIERGEARRGMSPEACLSVLGVETAAEPACEGAR
jgi:DNA-binding XRE family transcriptional regulator